MDRLKLIALDREDIEVVSAHLQDAVVKAADIHWRPAEKRLVVALNRFDWEAAHGAAPEFRRRRAALRFERVSPASAAIARPWKGPASEPARGLVRADRPARRRHHPDVLGRRRAPARGRMPGGRTGRSRPGWVTECCPAHTIEGRRAVPAASQRHPNRVDAPSAAGH